MIPELNEIIEKPENRKEEIAEAAEIKIKYKGYIEREKMVANKMHRLEDIKIRGHFNYSDILEISTEGRQKLQYDIQTPIQHHRLHSHTQSVTDYYLI